MDLEFHAQSDWELLASGNGRKIERFGEYILERPAPQAIWDLPTEYSNFEPSAVFIRKSDGTGTWQKKATMPERWSIELFKTALQLRMTGFGNVGVFPEHAVHWSWMYELLKDKTSPDVLNLFSYTGGASIVCAKAGARVTHVDSAKSVNEWAGINVEYSNIIKGSVRFIEEDAVKFIKREERRKKKYQGIIIDPPTFGRGNKGEVWKIERDFSSLLHACQKILAKDASFLLVTSHSPGITPGVLRVLLARFEGKLEFGEMILKGKETHSFLPVGVYARLIIS